MTASKHDRSRCEVALSNAFANARCEHAKSRALMYSRSCTRGREYALAIINQGQRNMPDNSVRHHSKGIALGTHVRSEGDGTINVVNADIARTPHYV